MALLEKLIYVKKSQLPKAGNGLFAKVFIPKGTRIVEYKGRITTWKEVNGDDGKNAYIYYVKRNFVIDAAPFRKALARYANDANGLHKIPGLRNNAKYSEDGERVYIDATRDIKPGDEIFVDYGREYWQVIRHNLRVDKQLAEQTKKNRKK